LTVPKLLHKIVYRQFKYTRCDLHRNGADRTLMAKDHPLPATAIGYVT
jgi:hypothetical protein